MANGTIYSMSSTTSDYYNQWPGGELQGDCEIGNETFLGGGVDGALRFDSIPLNQGVTVNSAFLGFYVQSTSNSGNTLRTTTYGIAQDNCAAFTSNPFGRATTSSSSNDGFSVPGGTGGLHLFGVTSQVNEILARGGWSNGNAMGFIIRNNASDSNAWISNDHTTPKSMLILRVNALPNFFPTPGTVSAPTFPGSQSYGIAVSQPGQDVKTATEAQLYYTSRKREYRVSQEIGTSGRQIAHGLGYAPAVLGYFVDAGTVMKVMNDPISLNAANSYISSDSTNVNLNQFSTAYVYIFIDPLT